MPVAFQTARRCWPRARPRIEVDDAGAQHLPAGGRQRIDRDLPAARQHRPERPAERRAEQRDAGDELHPAESPGAGHLRPEQHGDADGAERDAADGGSRGSIVDGRSQRSTRRNQMGTTATISAARPVGTYSSDQASPTFETPSRMKPTAASAASWRRLTRTERPVRAQQASIREPEIVNLTPARKREAPVRRPRGSRGTSNPRTRRRARTRG